MMYRMNIEWTNFAEGADVLPNTDIKSKHIDWDSNRRVHLHRSNISGIDPIVEGIENIIIKELSIKNIAATNGRYTMYVGDCQLMVVFAKKGGRYYVNGLTANVGTLTKAIARTIIRASSVSSYDDLEDYLYRCIELPEEISYVLENKLPYDFFEMTINDSDKVAKKFNQGHEYHLVPTTYGDWDFTHHECRLEVKQIDDENFAIELFSGVWGELTLKQLGGFINTFMKNHRINRY